MGYESVELDLSREAYASKHEASKISKDDMVEVVVADREQRKTDNPTEGDGD